MYYHEEMDEVLLQTDVSVRTTTFEDKYGIGNMFPNKTMRTYYAMNGTDEEVEPINEMDLIDMYNSKAYELRKAYTELNKLKKEFKALNETLERFSNDSYAIENEHLQEIDNLKYTIKILDELNRANENVIEYLRKGKK